MYVCMYVCVCVCVCVCIEIIDFCKSDSMIEIYVKLNKSNPLLKLRCVIFRLALFNLELLQTETVFGFFSI